METLSATGRCLEHDERRGTPCPRCGTFRCAECLDDGLCPPCRGTADVVRPVQPEDTYGFGRRAGGRVIDLLGAQAAGFGGGIVAAIVLAVLEAAGVVRSGWLQRFDHGLGFNFLTGTSAAFLGAAISGWVGGASLGKAILGMRIVSTDGRRAGLGANLKRELVYVVDAFFFGLVAKSAMDASPLQQRHGDRFADTTVVSAAALTGATVYPVLRMVLGVALGFLVQVVLLSLFFVLGAL